MVHNRMISTFLLTVCMSLSVCGNITADLPSRPNRIHPSDSLSAPSDSPSGADAPDMPLQRQSIDYSSLTASSAHPQQVTGAPQSSEAPSAPGKKYPWRVALRTNMLYDMALVPNVGVELQITPRITAGARWMYAWWSNSSRHRFWRIYGGDLFARWWLKPAEVFPTGHHFGLFGGAFIYDFEFGGKGHMAGAPGDNVWQKCQWEISAEYGYSLPISRRLNLDFSIGIGYVGGNYVTYHPQDGHYVWDETRRRSWFGPTKLEVSLVWLLGKTNFNRKKGGAK